MQAEVRAIYSQNEQNSARNRSDSSRLGSQAASFCLS